MAIRVLSRRHLHRALSSPIQITPNPPREFQSLSGPPDPQPQIPLQSPEIAQFNRHQIAAANALLRYGFPRSELLGFIRKNRFLSDSTRSDVESCVRALLSFGLTQNSLTSVLLNCPRALQLGFAEEWRSALLGFGFSAVSPSLISRVLAQSGKFRIEPEDFCKGARAMRSLGFSDGTIIRVFEELPAAFTREPVEVGRRVEVLVDFGIEKEEVDRICFEFPTFLAFGVDGRLGPLFQEFRGLGFSLNEVKSVLLGNARLLLSMEAGEMSRCSELIRSLKCRAPIKEKILSKGRLRASTDVKLRVDFLCKYGLIKRDAFKVLYLEPRCILYELRDIEKKINFLIQNMGFTVEHLLEFPEYLGVSLDKHTVPRFNVIEHLKSIGGLGFDVQFKHFVRLSRLKFYNLYVKPYPECEKIFGGVVREKEVRPRHPPGLWKMFKPKKFPDSREDVRNMKLFVESLV
ncbi:uncharacterized protein A4U43_C06F19680 [Asparagus officinalis]|uniref:Transcription termination factor MTERF15, mitochondrial n=1 Tax=Asparagus officinalis TaxID=4686 RepID=A0A5P1ES48_ASPOF|nr:transcription termination factor MTERF15, mitochondrial [Asparagus officinalis]ONK67391.1 uncharacterized protein A4U43_C06F19680 [Asparagus officinalis]